MAWFGGGGVTSTASTSSGIMWYGNNTSTNSTVFTGINCWTGGGGGGTCTTTEYFEYQQIQTLQMQHQQSLMQMQMQAQQIYAAQGLGAQQAAPQLNEDQRRALQAQAEALNQARLEQLQKSEEAGTKAKELLLEHLTPAQKETFNKNNWFVVEGGKSKQQYRIQAGSCTINIEVLKNKKVSHKLCAHLHHSAGAPLHDHILAQKIMLEYAEDDFLKIANRHAA